MSRMDTLSVEVDDLDEVTGHLTRRAPVEGAARRLVLVRHGDRVVRILHLEAGDPLPAPRPDAPRPCRGWSRADGTGLRATVVLCTVGSSQLLRAAVEALLAQDHTDLEVLVVDNAPTTGGTRKALAGLDDPRLRIVDEPRPGLARARNTGVRQADPLSDVIAFTDDDAIAEPGWLGQLLAPLGADATAEVGGTTGIVMPAAVDDDAARFFESRGGFPKDTRPLVWGVGALPPAVRHLGQRVDGGPLYPFTTARVGAGVSMAFRRDALIAAGPFDEALGAGTETLGGEDLDMFSRVMRSGRVIVHTPDAVVRHRHRSSVEALHRQIRGNGVGMSALLTKAIVHEPWSVLAMASRVPAVLTRLRPGSERIVGGDPDVPTSLTREEALGFLDGPRQYVRARRRLRREQ